MKAAVFYGPRDIRVEEVERPKIEATDILIKVRACGICGSDLHFYKLGLFPELGAPTDSGRIPGHEFSGDIAEVGSQVEGLKEGDRVSAITMGAMAEYVRVTPALLGANVFKLPPEVSHEEAATLEPLSTSLHAVGLAKPAIGETIVIFGAGIIGLGVLQCLRALTLTKTIVVDMSERRLAMAKQMGADVLINASVEDPYRKALELTGSTTLMFLEEPAAGVDIIFDCVGFILEYPGIPVIQQAMWIVREGGRVVVVGAFEEAVPLNLGALLRKNAQALGSFAYTPQEVGQALELIRTKRVDRKALITHEFPLEQAKEAFETQLKVEESIKVLVKP